MPSKNPVTGFRFSPDLLKRIDAYAAQLSHEMGGAHVSRAFAVSKLIAIGLETEERRKKKSR